MGGAIDHPDNAVPYDFHMNLGENSEVFCSETAYIGYRVHGVKLPLFPTHIDINKNDLARRLEIERLDNYAPGDTELDVRFDYVGEWRDYRKLKEIRQKDAVLSVIYDWMAKYDYRFDPSTKDQTKALIAFISRRLDLNFVRKKLPLNMQLVALQTIMTLDSIGQILQDKLELEEKAYRRTHNGLPLPMPEAKRRLGRFRLLDQANYRDGNHSDFHEEFHPPQR